MQFDIEPKMYHDNKINTIKRYVKFTLIMYLIAFIYNSNIPYFDHCVNKNSKQKKMKCVLHINQMQQQSSKQTITQLSMYTNI